MTKAQVEKHKEVMLWFINNPEKGVWRRSTCTGGWLINYKPLFSTNFIYVQNDEYAKFRKALADNLKVEYRHTPDKPWRSAEGIKFEEVDVACFQIKPDEPKFKVGDWVTIKGRNQDNPKQITDIWLNPGTKKYMFSRDDKYNAYYISECIPFKPKFKVGDLVVMTHIGCYKESLHRIVELFEDKDWAYIKDYTQITQTQPGSCELKNLRKWEPQRGKLCVFWEDSCNTNYTIRNFKETIGNYNYDAYNIAWDNVAPLEFIEILKDK